jgi:hypothetical protein
MFGSNLSVTERENKLEHRESRHLELGDVAGKVLVSAAMEPYFRPLDVRSQIGDEWTLESDRCILQCSHIVRIALDNYRCRRVAIYADWPLNMNGCTDNRHDLPLTSSFDVKLMQP